MAAVEAGSYAVFEERDRLALQFADAMSLDSNGVTEEQFAAMRASWDEGEIVEIAMVAGLFSYFNRFNNALRVEITR